MSIVFCSTMIACTKNSDVVATLSPSPSIEKFCERLPRSAYATLDRIEYDSDWFELYKVAPGVTAIYEPHQWQEVISYLIEGEKKALLFDTGNGIDDIRKVVESLTDKPVEVLNSHSHYDHVGDNYQFDVVYGMDTAFTHLRQKGRTPEQIGEEVSEAALCVPAPHNKTPQNHVGKPFEITKLVKDGDIIDLGNRQLKVIHTPGHTPDAIALLDAEHGLMWTGDTFYLGTIWLYSDETDLAAYKESLETMIAQIPNLKALLPAHNTPRVDPAILLEVRTAYDQMIEGQFDSKLIDEGMREYFPTKDMGFSFLMRDGPLPYGDK